MSELFLKSFNGNYQACISVKLFIEAAIVKLKKETEPFDLFHFRLEKYRNYF